MNESSSLLPPTNSTSLTTATAKSAAAAASSNSTSSCNNSGSKNNCCLIENTKRCYRPAGSHSFSKRMQKTVRQKHLKVSVDSQADHSMICQMHRQQLISEGKNESSSMAPQPRKRPYNTANCSNALNDSGKDLSDEEPSSSNKRKKSLIPVHFEQLSAAALRRYKKFFKLQTKPGLNKTQLAEVIGEHFRTIPVNNEKEILTYFVYAVKTKKNKLDNAKQNGNNDD